MSTPDLTSILEELAAGRITPSEAAARIDAAKAEAAPEGDLGRPQYATYRSESVASDAAGEATDGVDSTDTPSERVPGPEADPAPAPERGKVNGVERISVRGVGRRVRIVGDPKISTVTVEGTHVLRRNGAVMEITSDGDIGPSLDGFSMLKPPRNLDDFRSLGLGKELLIRVNPKLTADIELTAGSLRTDGVPFLGRLRVTAGSAKLQGVAEVEDALIQAGSAIVEGAVRTGRSRIRCESGNLIIRLDDASNVTVKAESQLGRIAWSGGHSGAGDEVVMGHGNARLDVGVVMGNVQLRVGSAQHDE